MRPVSARFLEALTRSHHLATSFTVLASGNNIGTIDEVIGGGVTLDATAATRGRLDLTLVDDGTLGLVPTDAGALLAPFGHELAVKRGIQYPNGDVELAGLGVFRLDSADIDDSAAGMQIKIAAPDRSAIVIDARFEEPYQVDAGQNYPDAIRDTLLAGYPSMQYDFAESDATTPLLLAAEGDDRWAFCQSMAEAIGMSLYFDGDGICVLRPVASLSNDPVATFAEGPNGALLSASRQWTRQGTYNRVIFTGENTGETVPVRGVATDDDPASPTYYYGPFGRVPMFQVSSFVTTDDQAASAAAAVLNRQLGIAQSVSFGSVVNPAIEPGDVCTITRERAGIDEPNVVDAITIPLDAASPMTGRTRARQVV